MGEQEGRLSGSGAGGCQSMTVANQFYDRNCFDHNQLLSSQCTSSSSSSCSSSSSSYQLTSARASKQTLSEQTKTKTTTTTTRSGEEEDATTTTKTNKTFRGIGGRKTLDRSHDSASRNHDFQQHKQHISAQIRLSSSSSTLAAILLLGSCWLLLTLTQSGSVHCAPTVPKSVVAQSATIPTVNGGSSGGSGLPQTISKEQVRSTTMGHESDKEAAVRKQQSSSISAQTSQLLSLPKSDTTSDSTSQMAADEEAAILLALAGAKEETSKAPTLSRLIKRSGISDQRLAEIQMIRALKKQLERDASKTAAEREAATKSASSATGESSGALEGGESESKAAAAAA